MALGVRRTIGAPGKQAAQRGSWTLGPSVRSVFRDESAAVTAEMVLSAARECGAHCEQVASDAGTETELVVRGNLGCKAGSVVFSRGSRGLVLPCALLHIRLSNGVSRAHLVTVRNRDVVAILAGSILLSVLLLISAIGADGSWASKTLLLTMVAALVGSSLYVTARRIRVQRQDIALLVVVWMRAKGTAARNACQTTNGP
jgi:hypothetical protein